MNLFELKQKVDWMCSHIESSGYRTPEQYQIVIPVEMVGSIGCHPFVDVNDIFLGFDWDDGKVFVNPVTRLREVGLDELAKIRKEYGEIAWSAYKISKIKKENEQLKEKLSKYEQSRAGT